MTTLINDLAQIGAIQFGQFERADQPGETMPLACNLRTVPSYPTILAALAAEIAPLCQIEGVTHLLPMAAAVPLGAAISLYTGLPLVYPVGTKDGLKNIEGAYDFNVPTVLLTDVLTNGHAEQQMIALATPLGLDVKFVVSAITITLRPLSTLGALPVRTWRTAAQLVTELDSIPSRLREAVLAWLANT